MAASGIRQRAELAEALGRRCGEDVVHGWVGRARAWRLVGLTSAGLSVCVDRDRGEVWLHGRWPVSSDWVSPMPWLCALQQLSSGEGDGSLETPPPHLSTSSSAQKGSSSEDHWELWQGTVHKALALSEPSISVGRLTLLGKVVGWG